MTKTIPKKKKCKKAKWLSQETLQIAEERREVKGKGEKERYTQVNAEFQRTARRDEKKSYVNNAKKQMKTTEQERLEISSKITGDIKGLFHARMGMTKDRNSKDLTEAEDIKKRWQEYTEELYKKGLHDPDNHDGVVTHLEVKWALGSVIMNKASGGNGIPTQLFQILEDDAIKVLHSIC